MVAALPWPVWANSVILPRRHFVQSTIVDGAVGGRWNQYDCQSYSETNRQHRRPLYRVLNFQKCVALDLLVHWRHFYIVDTMKMIKRKGTWIRFVSQTATTTTAQMNTYVAHKSNNCWIESVRLASSCLLKFDSPWWGSLLLIDAIVDGLLLVCM